MGKTPFLLFTKTLRRSGFRGRSLTRLVTLPYTESKSCTRFSFKEFLAMTVPPLLTDDDLPQLIDMPFAVEVMEQVFCDHAGGKLRAPARLSADLEAGRLVFTTGARLNESPSLGFRVYDVTQLHSPQRDELTAVFRTDTGALKGLILGPLLGAIRTGAIGGLAIKSLAPRHTKTVGILGAGYQACTQFQAAQAVCAPQEYRIYSRSAKKRKDFAETIVGETDARVEICESARDVVEAADVLICATTSKEPLFDSAWLKPHAHVNTIGPKFHSGSELDAAAAARAELIVTDSRAQAAAFGEDFILAGTDVELAMVELSEIVSGNHPGRSTVEGITLFYSLGLAGTEVALAERVLERYLAQEQ